MNEVKHMIRPTLSEAKEYAKQGYHMVPVCYEMLSDIITPINLLKKLKAENEHCYILESVENQELWEDTLSLDTVQNWISSV